jgi:nitrate/nitrite-specific signal transduction histidine kinase
VIIKRQEAIERIPFFVICIVLQVYNTVTISCRLLNYFSSEMEEIPNSLMEIIEERTYEITCDNDTDSKLYSMSERIDNKCVNKNTYYSVANRFGNRTGMFLMVWHSVLEYSIMIYKGWG